jgi:hypothetical protein
VTTTDASGTAGPTAYSSATTVTTAATGAVIGADRRTDTARVVAVELAVCVVVRAIVTVARLCPFKSNARALTGRVGSTAHAD